MRVASINRTKCTNAIFVHFCAVSLCLPARLRELVGAAGFEPTTTTHPVSRYPSKLLIFFNALHAFMYKAFLALDSTCTHLYTKPQGALQAWPK